MQTSEMGSCLETPGLGNTLKPENLCCKRSKRVLLRLDQTSGCEGAKR